MPATSFREYARIIADTLEAVVGTGHAALFDLLVDERSTQRGFISGRLLFEDGSELHFRDFVDVVLPDPRLTYAYHFQDARGDLVFRYDNAAHRPPLPQREHKHTRSRVIVSVAPGLADVIDEGLAPGW